MKAFVDKNTCIGCGLCPTICPDIFRMDDDGLAIAEDIDIPEDILPSAKEAEENCPSNSITVDNM
ncbi:MAG: ferredoxin [Bacilli bacterium]|nr:ferredoxin [Bacilli bacterium]